MKTISVKVNQEQQAVLQEAEKGNRVDARIVDMEPVLGQMRSRHPEVFMEAAKDCLKRLPAIPAQLVEYAKEKHSVERWLAINQPTMDLINTWCNGVEDEDFQEKSSKIIKQFADLASIIFESAVWLHRLNETVFETSEAKEEAKKVMVRGEKVLSDASGSYAEMCKYATRWNEMFEGNLFSSSPECQTSAVNSTNLN